MNIRAFNAESSTYPNIKSHKLTDSTFPILKLSHMVSSKKGNDQSSKNNMLFMTKFMMSHVKNIYDICKSCKCFVYMYVLHLVPHYDNV